MQNSKGYSYQLKRTVKVMLSDGNNCFIS